MYVDRKVGFTNGHLLPRDDLSCPLGLSVFCGPWPQPRDQSVPSCPTGVRGLPRSGLWVRELGLKLKYYSQDLSTKHVSFSNGGNLFEF